MKRSPLSALARRTPEPPVSWLMSAALADPEVISLAAGFTDSASLPVALARRLCDRILRRPARGRAALQYGTTVGDPSLRELTAGRLQAQDAAALRAAGGSGKVSDALYAASRLVMTSGSQQLLYTVSEALCDPGDLVLVEDPTYFVYLGIVQSHGLRCVGVPLEPDGMRLEVLEQRLEELRRQRELPRLKLLYLVSYFQNPTGTTTAYAKKAAILRLLRRYEKAAGHPLYLLEDAAYRELRFAGSDLPSCLTLPGARERVIYAGTFSKPFATGARVGFGLLPAPLREAVLHIKANHDFGSSNLLQHLLRELLASGEYDAHLAELRQRYAFKAGVLQRSLRRHFPADVAWRPPGGGLYVWAGLPAATATGPQSPFFQAAVRHKVLYVPGVYCYAETPHRARPDHEMRLSFGGAGLGDLRRGIARLGETLHEMRAKAPARAARIR